jgi:hypothetical protein
MPLQVGGQAIAAIHYGSTPIAEGWIWDGAQWVPVFSTAVAFADSGMDKSGSYAATQLNTWLTLPSWVPRAGYADTTIESNGIAVPAGVTVDCSMRVSLATDDSYGGGLRSARIVGAGGAVIASAQSPSQGSAITATGRYTPDVDAVVTVQFSTTSSSFDRHVVNGGSGTYLTVDVVA